MTLTFYGGLMFAVALLASCENDEYTYIGTPGRTVFYAPERDASNVTSEDPGALPPSVAPEGDISFMMMWTFTAPPGGPDIDMFVQEPGGETLSSSPNLGLYMGPTTSGGRIDLDDTGTGTGGPERAFWPTGEAPVGTYTYGVNWYSGTEEATVTFRVYIGDTIVDTHVLTIDEQSQARTLGTVDYTL